MPLPSKRADEESWQFDRYNIHGLESRDSYINIYKPKRVRQLKQLIKKYRPTLVIFYSRRYFKDWVDIIEAEPDIITTGMHFLRMDTVSFCCIPQGRVAYARLIEFADKIKKRCDQPFL